MSFPHFIEQPDAFLNSQQLRSCGSHDHRWCGLLLFRAGVHSSEAATALLFEADRNAMTTLALAPP
jgi:hypothetical protein